MSVRVRRFQSVVLAALIILAGIILLMRSLCSPLDITDDAARNGGYGRGMVFVLRVPVFVSNDQYAVRESEPRRQGDVSVPAGCRLEIVKVMYIREFVADNIARAQPLARWLDGPLAGKTVYLQGISNRTPPPNRLTMIDPACLAPVDPAAPSSMQKP